MKNKSILPVVGIIMYLMLSITDKFIVSVPDLVYIIVGIFSIILIVIGLVKDRIK